MCSEKLAIGRQDLQNKRSSVAHSLMFSARDITSFLQQCNISSNGFLDTNGIDMMIWDTSMAFKVLVQYDLPGLGSSALLLWRSDR